MSLITILKVCFSLRAVLNPSLLIKRSYAIHLATERKQVIIYSNSSANLFAVAFVYISLLFFSFLW